MQEHAPNPPHDEDDLFDDDLARLQAEELEDESVPTFDDFPRVPRELKRLDQWVNWHQEEGRKIPLNPRTLRNAGVGYENTWSTYHFATAVAERENLGIGFVLTEQDPFTCIDLDKVIDGKELKPYAREILDAVQSYVELSPSGTGLHVWVKSREAFNRRTQGIEVYSDHRWMTVTGRANPRVPTEIPDRTEQVKQLIDERFPKQEAPIFSRPAMVEQDDATLWQRLFSAKNGNFLQALYDGDLSVVKDDHSRGVIMLANMLAVYTHGDAGRMESLLAQTNLVNEKWHEKRGQLTWIQFQIQDAIGFVHRRESARQSRERKQEDVRPAQSDSGQPREQRTGLPSTRKAEETKEAKNKSQRKGAKAGPKGDSSIAPEQRTTGRKRGQQRKS